MREEIEPVERDEAESEPSVGPDIAGVRAQVESLEEELDRLEHETNHGMGQNLEDIEQLRDRLDEQERMIGELVEVVEVLTLAVDGTELKNAMAAHENGAEVPIAWRGSAHEFVSAQYR
jgi:small-conductance mechanosensitive channel